MQVIDEFLCTTGSWLTGNLSQIKVARELLSSLPAGPRCWNRHVDAVKQSTQPWSATIHELDLEIFEALPRDQKYSPLNVSAVPLIINITGAEADSREHECLSPSVGLHGPLQDRQGQHDRFFGHYALWELTDALMEIPSGPPAAAAIPELFNVMERMPDADLGSPGPLVHSLEALKEYQAELMRSTVEQSIRFFAHQAKTDGRGSLAKRTLLGLPRKTGIAS